MISPSFVKFSDIAVVGAGQLGSRYLQGLAKCNRPLRIWVIDPNSESLALAQHRWLEVGGQLSPHSVEFSISFKPLPKNIELALITTTANVRVNVVRELASIAEIKYWVLEKVLAQSCTSLDDLLRLTSDSSGCWVNTPRRIMGWHQQLHKLFNDRQPIKVLAGDNLWGMGCNAVHFLDLVAWWSGSDLVLVDTDSLDSSWIPSKRPGFFEVTGTLSARYANGTTLSLVSSARGQAFTLMIDTLDGRWKVTESQGLAIGPAGQTLAGHIEFQSDMTSRLVETILETGRCDLPTLNASVDVHRPFLQSMLSHWNRSGQRNDTILPIT